MTERKRRLKQPPSIFAIAVIVGAVGLSLGGSTGFFLAFAGTFLIGYGAVLVIRQRRGSSTYGSEPPGEEPPRPVPRRPVAPVDQGGAIHQDKSMGHVAPAQRGRKPRHKYES